MRATGVVPVLVVLVVVYLFSVVLLFLPLLFALFSCFHLLLMVQPSRVYYAKQIHLSIGKNGPMAL